MRCEICGLTNDCHRMALVQTAEVVNGRLSWCQKEVCPRCVGRYAVVMPSRTVRDLTMAALNRTHEAVTRALIHKVVADVSTTR